MFENIIDGKLALWSWVLVVEILLCGDSGELEVVDILIFGGGNEYHFS
jgi:hypothetical protein